MHIVSTGDPLRIVIIVTVITVVVVVVVKLGRGETATVLVLTHFGVLVTAAEPDANRQMWRRQLLDGVINFNSKAHRRYNHR